MQASEGLGLIMFSLLIIILEYGSIVTIVEKLDELFPAGASI